MLVQPKFCFSFRKFILRIAIDVEADMLWHLCWAFDFGEGFGSNVFGLLVGEHGQELTMTGSEMTNDAFFLKICR